MICIIKYNYQMNNPNRRKPLAVSPKSFPIANDGSPVKGNVLILEEHIDYIAKLSSRRQNFCTCLDLYKVSYENGMPQRCIEHNNFITLYCQDQFRLLCVNCIYNSIKHKDHKVVPSKNSISAISRDNDDNIRLLNQELEKIRYTENQVKKNQKTLQEEYSLILKEMDSEFNKIFEIIEKKHAECKEKIVDSFNRANRNNQEGFQEVGWWREELIKIKQSLPKESQNQEAEIYKHLVLTLVQNGKIDAEKLTFLASPQEMRDNFLREVIETRQILQSRIEGTNKSESYHKGNRPF